MWQKLNQSLSGVDDDGRESFFDDESDGLCSLSATQRMYGFAACLIAGLVLMILVCVYHSFYHIHIATLVAATARKSTYDGLGQNRISFRLVVDVYDLINIIHLQVLLLLQSLIVFAKPIKFAILFTFGNVLAVGSTAFLLGLGQQMRMMFDSVRIYATAIYLGCVVIALICALWVSMQYSSFDIMQKVELNLQSRMYLTGNLILDGEH
ncbi:hypothetical protein FEM48_Zijuj03G0174800 [Ziziphus jujuba var. spinosa]|uniref:Vesicle transport protein n=1 Tax=Ziziphus jujuba var. spinosa TaxID=714518 RepID=A0A978VRN6_ZIZJJ|nr:hypothetical protein FEM48_Zijuj03G0174800 [Ziziphus jujuba var. spinosa]